VERNSLNSVVLSTVALYNFIRHIGSHSRKKK